MEKYLNKGIKDLISEFPEVRDILNEYNIGCVPCSVGSCLLKDIVQIHNLSPEDEEELMARITRAIYPVRNLAKRDSNIDISNGVYPDRKIKMPKIKKKAATESKEVKYSPPIQKLVDEHALIKKWLVLIPEVIEKLDIETEDGRKLVCDGVYFIRSYADKFHHAKEEDILFKYFDGTLDIIKAMHEDHETGRAHVRAIIEALERKDKKAIIEHLNGYKELLTGHIKKEDESLYPWMDRGLSIQQVGELFAKFNEAEEKIGKEVVERCRKFVTETEQRMKII
ncbi:MAG: hemerythrin domain-containing protein [Nitrospinae bacterium]|nr:hemerythrin domain-containing protein [Nitrospinota bacterium]